MSTTYELDGQTFGSHAEMLAYMAQAPEPEPDPVEVLQAQVQAQQETIDALLAALGGDSE